jgi:hypothetical protein
MINGAANYSSPAFIATTLLTVGFLFYLIKRAGRETTPGRIAVSVVAFWLLLQATLALGGFYQSFSSVPPRIFAFGAIPSLIFVLAFSAWYGTTFIKQLPIGVLTLLHVIRVPVELVLYSLFIGGQVPEAMTFAGRNLDILSGITAPIAYLLFVRRGVHRLGLMIWNLAALGLLINIVSTAIVAFPSPFQQIAFDQPNVAIMYFPYVWLPTIVVPIVLFAHIAALIQLFSHKGARQ